MASEMDTTRSDTAPQCDAVATPTVQNSPIEETSTQDVVTPEGKDMPIEPTRPDIGPQSDAVVTSAVHDSTIEETSTQDVSSQVQDTSTEPTYSDTAPQSESIATLTVQDSPVGEISTQDVPQGIEIQPIQSASAITEVEKSDGVEKVALASPFDSPKPTAKNIRSETPKVAEEAADISDLPVDAQSSDKDELVEAISVVVNGHKEVRHVSGATDEAPKSSPTVHGLQKSKYVTSPNEIARSSQVARLREAPKVSKPFQRSSFDIHMELNRTNALLKKAEKDLEAERNDTVHLRRTIAEELQQKMEASSSVMLANLLRNQGETLALKARVDAKERELQFREKKIFEIEVYLADGQKLLLNSLEEAGDRPASEIQIKHAQRQAKVEVEKTLANIEGSLTIKNEGLKLRQNAQLMREQQYKTLIREVIQAEMSQKAVPTEQVDKIAEGAYNDGFAAGKEASRKDALRKNNDIAEDEYNNGFAAGKEAGRKEVLYKAHQRGFLEGYGACHRTQVALSKVRQGLIPCDSPELDFLYDVNHPDNIFNIGELLGRMEKEDKIKQASRDGASEHTKTEIKQPEQNGKMQHIPEQKPVLNGKMPIMNGRMNGYIEHHLSVPEYKPLANIGANIEIKPATNGRYNGYIDKDPITSSKPVTAPQKPREEPVPVRQEPFRTFPPAKPSFAAELRGASAMHHGHVVLANNSASPSPSPAPVKDVGRPIIKYEQEDEVDLIDLM